MLRATTPSAGNFAALKQLRPIETNYGDIIEGVVEKQQAKKARDEAENAAREKKKNDLAKKFGIDYKGLNEIVTQTKSIDEAFARGINSARDRLGELYKGIEEDPASANDIGVQMQIQNLNKYSQHLKTASDRYTAYASMVTEGMQDGSLSNWNKEELADLDSIFSQANLDVKVDQETGLPIAVIAELDENMEPTGELKELNLIEVLDGRGLSQAVNTFDFQASITDIGTKLGKRDVKEPGSGLTHIEYQQFEDIEPEVRTMLRGFLGTERNPTNIAKSIWSDQMGLDPTDLDAEDMGRIEDFYVNAIRGFYDEKNNTTKDFGTGFRYANAARNRKEEKQSLGLQVRTDEDGRPQMQELVGVQGVPKGNYFQFTLPEPITLGIKGDNKQITNLMINEAGEIAYEETIYKGKTSGVPIDPEDVELGKISGDIVTETNYGGGLGAKELNDIARKLNFRNTKELKDALLRAKQGTAPTGNIDTSKYN